MINEETPVMRPTKVERIGLNEFIVLPISDFKTSGEEWEFPSGARVICEEQKHDGEHILVTIKET